MRQVAGNVVIRVRDVVRTELWPAPALGIVTAVAAGVLLPRLDARMDGRLPDWAVGWLFGGGAGAARTVLDAVASSLITVTSLTFSLTVVTLQLAGSQFSPRLLRTFTRDRFVHLTLALFLATFTYALTVLRTVRTQEGDQDEFVPQVAVSLAFVLALASVIALVLFLSHLAREIRVETVLRNVRAEASLNVRGLLPEGGATPADASPQPPAWATLLPAPDSGFLVRIDEQQLVRACLDADAVVRLDRQPGAMIVAGHPIGACWPAEPGSGPFDPDAAQRLLRRVGACIFVGFERTAAQDVGFGLRQITDVALKALSPGINDPTTAVHALGHASALLCELAGRATGPRLLRDDDGRVRVALQRPGLPELLDLAVAQPARYGADDDVVLERLLLLLDELAWATRDSGAGWISTQLGRLVGFVKAGAFDDEQTARLLARAEQVQRRLDRQPRVTPAAPVAPAAGGTPAGPPDRSG